MRKRLGWWILIAGLIVGLGAPAAALGQGMSYEVPPTIFTGPLSHPRYEDGGIYVGFGYLYWNSGARPLASQQVAIRGFKDTNGTITGTVGAYVGNQEEALNTNQLQGPSTYQPGWDLHIGWRTQGGIVIEANWKHLTAVQYHASASIIPHDFNVGQQLENTFLFSPVSNFPNDFAGADQNVPQGTPGATYGIWNAASLMQLTFTQRFDIYQVNVRMPMNETQDHRTYALFGPRVVWIWERFAWRSVDTDVVGNTAGDTIATYSNVVSNRMYGVHAGFGNDWFLGTTPIGGLAFTFELESGLYANLVKARAAYTLEDRSASYNRGRNFASLVPSVEGRVGLTWYPWEAISMSVGYDVMMFFNTMASPKPIDFNLGLIDPQYEHYFFRWYHGINFNISFVF